MSYDYPPDTAQAKMATELQAIDPRRIPLKKRLEQQRAQLQKSLDELDAAIAFVEKNPQFEEFTNLISKVGLHY